jgi:uncharacterized protein (DUF58 family)
MKKSVSRTVSRLLSSSSLSMNLLQGAWKSAVSGQGLEVKDIRPFSQGDNPLSAVWSRFAQTGILYTKVFREERERTVYIAFDASGSLFQGRGVRAVFGKELAALLVWAASTSRDSIGLIINRKESVHVVRPKSSFAQLELLLQEIEFQETLPITSSLASFFMEEKEARGIKRSLLFYISDFIDPQVDWNALFLSLSLRHEVVLLRLTDDKEDEDLREAVGMPAFDPETGTSVMPFTSGMYSKRKELMLEQKNKAENAAASFHLPFFSLDVQKECLMQLIEILIRRRHRR